MQILTIAGNVGKDPELRTTPNGEHVLSFSLAVDNGKDKNGNKRDSTWYDCSIWGKRAQSLQGHITKGSKLTLSGRPSARCHNDKAYLGVTVNELAFQGGGQQQSEPQGGGYAGQGASAGAGGVGDLDDEIPFNRVDA